MHLLKRLPLGIHLGSTPVRRFLSMSVSESNVSGPVESSIREKLTSVLQPSSMIITNDSWKHRHHAAMRDHGDGEMETHFSIQVISEAFKGKTTMQRHRVIYRALATELEEGLHALSLQTKTPDETVQI